MLLYALYTPKQVDSFNQERVYAFASVERLVKALKKRDRNGKLVIVNKDDVKSFTFASFHGEKEAPLVLIREDAVQDPWDGKWVKVPLVHNMADEIIPNFVKYS